MQQACTRPITLNAHLGLFARARIGLRMARLRHRARRDQPFRGLRLHPLARPASPIPTCSCISCRRRSATTAAPPRPRTAFRCISGRCARPRAARCGSHSADPRDAAGDPLQLHERGGGLARFPHRHPADARDFCAAGASTISAAPEIAPGEAAQSDAALDDFVRENVESAYHPCGTCRMGARRRRERGGRSGMPRDRHARRCAWPIPRSSRRSPTAISTRRRSWSARRRPT